MTSVAEGEALGFPKAEPVFWQIVGTNPGKSDKAISEQEKAFLELGSFYKGQQDAQKLRELIARAREVTGGYAKSKTAKIIRALIEDMASVENSNEVQIETINECVAWAREAQRSFLRQNLEIRLVSLLHGQKQYQKAIELITRLLSELKRLDDKMMLVEIQLLESRVFHALRNLPKSRASLTSARTSANAIYTPTKMQAELDMMSGILQAEDGDYKTAFSYFYEAFEGYASLNDDAAVLSLKYLLLVKIMLNLTDDVEHLLANKTIKRYQGRDIDAMHAMLEANSKRSLQDFENVLRDYQKELATDSFIRSHFTALYDKLFQENLVKEIEPYSCVEITYLAKQIGLDVAQVEGKLSQMILDKVISGVLDQGNGWLYVYQEPRADHTYEMALEAMKHMSSVVDLLYEKAAAI